MKSRGKVALLTVLVCVTFLVMEVMMQESVSAGVLSGGNFDDVESFYNAVLKDVEKNEHTMYYYVSFDPELIKKEELNGRAFDKGGNELLAKLIYCSWDIESSDGKYKVTVRTGHYGSNKLEDWLTDKMADLIAKDCEGMTDYEKIRYVYDYIILHAEYSKLDGASNNLLHGSSCCNGYAEAFLILMAKMDIDCKFTTGSDHAWNTVYLDGQWYNIDTTWGDPGGMGVDYTFFLKCNKDWAGERPAQATATASYPVTDLDKEIHFPNYKSRLYLRLFLMAVVPIMILFVLIKVLRSFSNEGTRRKIERQQEEIRNMYRLDD